MATGLSRPGKSREGPGTGRDRTGPRDLEGPVVLAGQDLETLKVPGLFVKVPGPPRSLFSPLNITRNEPICRCRHKLASRFAGGGGTAHKQASRLFPRLKHHFCLLPLKQQWYFVTKIVPTYCEKKLF